MGYLLILLTVFCNVSKGGVSKVATRKLFCLADNVELTFIRNLICILVGFGIITFSGISYGMPFKGWLICVLSGVSMTVNYTVWLMCLKTDAYMLATTANSASFIIAALCGVVMFDEKISYAKAVSFVLILAAVYFMVRYQVNNFQHRMKLKDFFILFMVFLSAGTNSVCQKAFTFNLEGFDRHLFTFYTFVFSCLILLMIRMFIRRKEESAQESHIKKMTKLLPLILYMGITLYGATFFQTTATTHLDAVVVYPLSSALGLVGGAFMAWLCFKERPSRDSIIGTVLSLSALVLSKF